MQTETERIQRSYAKRSGEGFAKRYSFLSPAVYMSVQERERALLRWIRDCGVAPLASRRLIEIGCGSGQNLLDLLRFGFQPESGVDLENFRPLPVRSLFSSGDIVVGTVKTLEVKYGIEYLIRAFRLLKDMLAAIPLKLLIVGGGSQRARLESLARELGVWADTRFTGHVGHDEVPQYFNMLDIAVMPSIYDSESFGVSAIEASACCKPVVVCDVGGLPEVVEDGVTGLVVESRNEVAIATAIGRLVAEPGLRSKMGQAGRERVGKLYEWNANVEQMLSIYDEVAGSVPVGMPA